MSMAKFVTGAVVGATAALLLAPKTGQQTRAAVAEWLGEAGAASKHAAQAGCNNFYERVREVNEDAADILEDRVESAVRRASAAAEAAAEAAEVAVGTAAARASAAAEAAGVESAEDLRSKINEARDRLAAQAAEFAAASAGAPVDAHVVSVADVEETDE